MPQFPDQWLAVYQFYALDNSIGFDRALHQHLESDVFHENQPSCHQQTVSKLLVLSLLDMRYKTNNRQGTCAVKP